MATYQARIGGVNYFQASAENEFAAKREIVIGLIRQGASGLLKRWLDHGAEVRETIDLKKWIEKHFDREELKNQINVGDDAVLIL